ncbi:hypothetical protein HLB35_06355 [Halomonas sp. TBZ9]|uniref:Uncharacterized protein n=1 Tax=Vreelandella azerica TaxID=2732867 RepID=A0A7Y3TZF0_9GAMM|nr:hypothetical protein [Halomonas azerica]NOG31489.1 hypothetical protein [Halomonas azerica]
MKKLYTASAIAAALLSAPLAGQAATGQTSVSFNLPGIIILHYVSDVTFDVPASYFGGADQAFDDSVAKTLSGFDDDASVDISGGPLDASIDAVTAYIRNAWAVRSISATGESQIGITLDTATATHASAGSIGLSNAQVSADGTAFGATTTFDSPGMSRINAEYGDVSLELDMSSATSAGEYTGAQYTIEATNI